MQLSCANENPSLEEEGHRRQEAALRGANFPPFSEGTKLPCGIALHPCAGKTGKHCNGLLLPILHFPMNQCYGQWAIPEPRFQPLNGLGGTVSAKTGRSGRRWCGSDEHRGL
jgi:hypothetical protein